MLLITACNGPKKLTKKGDALAVAGIHKEAVELYMKALSKDRAHVSAIQGLRKSGGAVLNNFQSDFFRAYSNYEYKLAVYTYLEMEKFQIRLNKMNADLRIPRHSQEDYKDAKSKYLEQRFEEANELMARESFISAEEVFKEITTIEPNYRGEDLANLMEISKLEPSYRDANVKLDLNKNRYAYYEFKKVVDVNPNYKDAKVKMDEALELAKYPIGILKFKNFSYERGADVRVYSMVIDNLIKNKGPFLKVLDRSSMDRVLNEKHVALNGWVSGNEAVKAGGVIGAKAILSGKIISIIKSSEVPKPKTVRGYKKRVVKTYNRSTKKTTSVNVYDKVSFKNYKGHNSIKIIFQFMLVSTETGEILISEVVEEKIISEVNYNVYAGNYKDLVPGSWSYTWKKKPNDRIDYSRSGRRDLREKFNSNKNLRSFSSIIGEAYISVGRKAARKVCQFNPEQ